MRRLRLLPWLCLLVAATRAVQVPTGSISGTCVSRAPEKLRAKDVKVESCTPWCKVDNAANQCGWCKCQGCAHCKNSASPGPKAAKSKSTAATETKPAAPAADNAAATASKPKPAVAPAAMSKTTATKKPTKKPMPTATHAPSALDASLPPPPPPPASVSLPLLGVILLLVLMALGLVFAEHAIAYACPELHELDHGIIDEDSYHGTRAAMPRTAAT